MYVGVSFNLSYKIASYVVLLYQFLTLYSATSFEDGKEKETNEQDRVPEKSDALLTEGPPAPKAIPSWAALFKSNSDVPTSKGPPIVSVNYPEATAKPAVTNASKVTNDKSPSLVPVEDDHNALALAGIIYIFCI